MSFLIIDDVNVPSIKHKKKKKKKRERKKNTSTISHLVWSIHALCLKVLIQYTILLQSVLKMFEIIVSLKRIQALFNKKYNSHTS